MTPKPPPPLRYSVGNGRSKSIVRANSHAQTERFVYTKRYTGNDMIGAPSPTRTLFQECVRGNEDACTEAYQSLHELLARTARRVAFEYGSPGDTDEVVQEIYAKLTENRDAVTAALPDDEAAVLAYLAILAANAARDYFRAKGATKRGNGATVSYDDSQANISWALGRAPNTDREILVREIEGAMEGGEREKLVFRLFYRQGYSAAEIARIPALGLTTKGVESAIHRIAQRIRAKLHEEKGPSPPSH